MLPRIGITPIMCVKLRAIVPLKVVIVAILLRLPWRYAAMSGIVVFVVTLLLRLSRRYASMARRRIIRIVSRWTLCNTYDVCR